MCWWKGSPLCDWKKSRYISVKIESICGVRASACECVLCDRRAAERGVWLVSICETRNGVAMNEMKRREQSVFLPPRQVSLQFLGIDLWACPVLENYLRTKICDATKNALLCQIFAWKVGVRGEKVWEKSGKVGEKITISCVLLGQTTTFFSPALDGNWVRSVEVSLVENLNRSV